MKNWAHPTHNHKPTSATSCNKKKKLPMDYDKGE